MKSLKLITGYSCNNSCDFCRDREYRGKIADKSYSGILSELIAARKSGAAAVDILGGEATLRPDIFRILSAAKRLGYVQLLLTTNGWMLGDKKFVFSLLEAGVTEVRFSLHGDTARIHDRLTGVAGSFSRILLGVGNLRSFGFGNISVNTTLVNANCSRLAKIRSFLRRLRILKWNIIYVGEPEGKVKNTPRVSVAAPGIIKCLRSPEFEATLINAPVPCFFKEVHEKVEMFERTSEQYVSTRGRGQFLRNDMRKHPLRQRISACADCVMSERCSGVYSSYISAFGDGELRKKNGYGE